MPFCALCEEEYWESLASHQSSQGHIEERLKEMHANAEGFISNSSQAFSRFSYYDQMQGIEQQASQLLPPRRIWINHVQPCGCGYKVFTSSYQRFPMICCCKICRPRSGQCCAMCPALNNCRFLQSELRNNSLHKDQTRKN